MDFARMKTTSDTDYFLKKLWDIKAKREDKVPKGYYSVKDFAKRWGVVQTTAMMNVRQLVSGGALKKIKLRRFDGKRIVMVNYYG